MTGLSVTVIEVPSCHRIALIPRLALAQLFTVRGFQPISITETRGTYHLNIETYYYCIKFYKIFINYNLQFTVKKYFIFYVKN